MATIGTVDPFDCQSQTWEEYPVVFDYFFFFAANDIMDAGKTKALLLSCCGPATYTHLMFPRLTPCQSSRAISGF